MLDLFMVQKVKPTFPSGIMLWKKFSKYFFINGYTKKLVNLEETNSFHNFNHPSHFS